MVRLARMRDRMVRMARMDRMARMAHVPWPMVPCPMALESKVPWPMSYGPCPRPMAHGPWFPVPCPMFPVPWPMVRLDRMGHGPHGPHGPRSVWPAWSAWSMVPWCCQVASFCSAVYDQQEYDYEVALFNLSALRFLPFCPLWATRSELLR